MPFSKHVNKCVDFFWFDHFEFSENWEYDDGMGLHGDDSFLNIVHRISFIDSNKLMKFELTTSDIWKLKKPIHNIDQ